MADLKNDVGVKRIARFSMTYDLNLENFTLLSIFRKLRTDWQIVCAP